MNYEIEEITHTYQYQTQNIHAILKYSFYMQQMTTNNQSIQNHYLKLKSFNHHDPINSKHTLERFLSGEILCYLNNYEFHEILTNITQFYDKALIVSHV